MVQDLRPADGGALPVSGADAVVRRVPGRGLRRGHERYFGETLQWVSGDRLPEQIILLGGLLLPKEQ